MVGNVKNLYNYLEERKIRLEAEGLKEHLAPFFNSYCSWTGEELDEGSDGVRILHPDADKWALELRIYISDIENFPEDFSDSLTKQNNPLANEEYVARLNGNSLIKKLIKLGLRVGDN